MAMANIVPDEDTVIVEMFIAAPPQRVFDAITDPKQTSQWWGKSDIYRVTSGQSDLRPGGKWFSAGVGADGSQFQVGGEYLEVDTPRLLVQTWTPSYDPTLKDTVVRWELEPRGVHGLHQTGIHKAGTGTNVTIRHSGFGGNTKAATDHGEGWKRVLGWMQAFVEKGETVDTRS
jgi:uncharacterized protein YndB with AHSA1/START domain